MIPLHADDETDICNDSYIFTLSIGSTREMTFRDKFTKQHSLNQVNHTSNMLYQLATRKSLLVQESP